MALLALPIFAFFTWRAKLSNEVERKLSKIRAEGFPTDAHEWAKFYAVPDDDVTSLWREAVGVEGIGPLSGPEFTAAAASVAFLSKGDRLPALNAPWSDLDAAKALLEKYKKSVDTMHEAARLGGRARFPHDATQGFAMLLPEVQVLRTAARLLALEAHVKAREKDPHGAAESIHAVFMVARSLENDPVMISQLVRYATQGVGINLLKELLPYVDFSETDLRRLQEDLRAAQDPKWLVVTMAGERAFGIDAMRNPSRAVGVANTPWGATHEDKLLYIEIFDEMVAAAQADWPQTLDLARRSELKLQKRLKDEPLAKVRYMMASQIMPACTKIFEASGRHLAASRTADAAIAMVLFRRKEGRVPSTLDELVPDFLPAVPIDPFDGMPLRFRMDGMTCVIYSVGADRIDQQGVEQLLSSNEIVFRLEPLRE